MSYIEIIEEKCNGCGRCIKYCNYNAIKIIDGKAKINLFSCTLCKSCISKCKTGAIINNRLDRKTIIPERKGIWVIVEYFNKKVKNNSFQLLSKAVELSEKSGDCVTAILVGNKYDEVEPIKRDFSEYGIGKIKLLINENLNKFFVEDFVHTICEEIIADKPKIVLFSGTIFGRSLAPRVATRIKTGLTADCTDLQIDSLGNLLQIRPTFGGKVLATIATIFNYPQMASVRPNIFVEKKKQSNGQDIELIIKKININSSISKKNHKKIVKLIKNKNELYLPLDEAKTVYCVGLGVGSKEGFNIVESFARKNNATIAATREVVDKGWADFSLQIGQTGLTIRPEIYVGFGVSGAIQHIIGMKNSRKIIAINKDPMAPIFKIADYCIISDLFEFISKANMIKRI